MFLSLDRKIVYSIFGLSFLLLLIFSVAFFSSYVSKIETDQKISIQRNQQYSDLLYRVTNFAKEIRVLLKEYPEIVKDKKKYAYLYSMIGEEQELNVKLKEQVAIMERSKSFGMQYAVINKGLMIIGGSIVLIFLLLLFVSYLINKIILEPIRNIANVTEQVGSGNMDLRIPERVNVKYRDEFDSFGNIFNQMLDSLQKAVWDIKNNERFLQALIDSMPDGIRVIDENYNIVLANKNYYEQTGDKQKKCSTCHMSSFGLKYPCTSQNFPCPITEILHKRKKSVNLIQQFAHNPERHFAVSASSLVYDNKKRYVIEAIRDLSEDITFSHQQKVTSLAFLSSSIAHEIKNQLGALRIVMEHVMSKYYANKSEDNEEKKLMTMIYNELVNAISVPERLLKLTRSGNDTNVQIDCGVAVQEVLGMVDFEAKSRGIDIIFDNKADEAFVFGSEIDFKIAVINVVQNAIKAMAGKGVLTIEIETSSSELLIHFTDTGVGIAKENLKNIFMPFFSDGQQKTAGVGTGLGLPITKSVVEKFGGKIKVKSILGKGSKFSFCFPLNKKLAKN